MGFASRCLSPRYDQMFRSSTISHAQWEACRRYLALTEAIGGGLSSSLSGSEFSAWSGTEQQVRARLSLQAAHVALGPSARAFCDALILDNLAVRAIAERHGMRSEIIMGLVLAALTRLAEHWKLA